MFVTTWAVVRIFATVIAAFKRTSGVFADNCCRFVIRATFHQQRAEVGVTDSGSIVERCEPASCLGIEIASISFEEKSHNL